MIFPTLLGTAVFVALMWWIVHANAFMWRAVAAHYRGDGGTSALATKAIETIVITRRESARGPSLRNPEYRAYSGVRMILRRDGLALSILPPLNVRTPPLFLPFAEMELKDTYWALWPQPCAIRMRRTPDLDIVVDSGVARWIREHVEPAGVGS